MKKIEIRVILFIVYWCLCVSSLFAFEPVLTITWATGKEVSYFGYSVQLTGETVFVGAPLDSGSGAVFACKYRSCKKIIFEGTPSENYKSLITDQRLGISLDTHGTKLVACAPRWINNKYEAHYFFNGMCYLYNTENNITESLIPLLNISRQGYGGRFFYYVYGEAGFSTHFDETGGLTLGAPGVLRWLGSFARYNFTSAKTALTPFVPNPIHFYADILEPGFTNSPLEVEYFGYAVSSGKCKDGKIMHVAGAPRSNNLFGQVFMYEDKQPDTISILHKFTGREIGEYFGSVLAVADVTGDGYNDILVGAPLYSGRAVESGCIYLFIHGEKGFYQQTIDAPQTAHHRGRYGSAISVIGDINQDGFNDVAIGAPYEGHGVVYIHLGSKNGLVEQPYYRVIGDTPQSGFGISISRSLYNFDTGVTDIVVGAYKSATVKMIHFRPIIRVVASLTTSDSKLSVENVSTNNFEFSITACIKYSAGYLSKKNIVFNTTLITDPYYGRAILQSSKTVIACPPNNLCCNVYPIRIIENLESIKHFYEVPIEFRFNYHLVRNKIETITPEFPEVAFNNPISETLYVPFEIDCGEDELCQPKLKLEAKWLLDSQVFVIGSSQHIDAQVTIENNGENAYSCLLQVKHNIPLLRLPERCEQVKPGFLDCNIGNPLQKNAKVLTNQVTKYVRSVFYGQM